MNEQVKRGRGRPRKDTTIETVEQVIEPVIKKKPSKVIIDVKEVPEKVKEDKADIVLSIGEDIVERTTKRPNSLTVKELFELMRKR